MEVTGRGGSTRTSAGDCAFIKPKCMGVCHVMSVLVVGCRLNQSATGVEGLAGGCHWVDGIGIRLLCAGSHGRN